MATRWIAEEHVIWQFPDGQRKTGRVAVGEPERAPGGETICAYALDGLEYVGGPLRGAGGMQALCSALTFIGWKLHASWPLKDAYYTQPRTKTSPSIASSGCCWSTG